MLTAGVDEVGRGCLAGEVVSAAVILPVNHGILGLNDSKKLREHQREAICSEIVEKCICFSIGKASVCEIDRLNILKATMLSMQRAVSGLKVEPEFVLVDGNKLPEWKYKSKAIVKGDSLIEEISAASILAKVTRDKDMHSLDTLFPGYGFSKNKGYGTAQHLEALDRNGVTVSHRKTFSPIRELVYDRQEKLF
jgi:ribonuclease HII